MVVAAGEAAAPAVTTVATAAAAAAAAVATAAAAAAAAAAASGCWMPLCGGVTEDPAPGSLSLAIGGNPTAQRQLKS